MLVTVLSVAIVAQMLRKGVGGWAVTTAVQFTCSQRLIFRNIM